MNTYQESAMKIDLRPDGQLALTCGFEDKDLAKTIPGYSWDKVGKVWVYPVSALQDIRSRFPVAVICERVLEKVSEDNIRNQGNDEIKTGKGMGFTPDWFYDHQKTAYYLLENNKKYALFMEMGTGKTAVILSYIAQYSFRVLIVAPLALLKGAWLDDIRKFYPELESQTIIYHGSKAERERLIQMIPRKSITICNYESYRIDYDKLSAIPFDILVVDESSKMKTASSQITKFLIKHSQKVERRYILSGCPAPNNPFEYFSQIQFLDPGLLGNSEFKFKLQWGYRTGYEGHVWVMTKDRQIDMMKRIEKVSYFVNKDDCLDLPDRTHTKRMIPWMEGQRRAYDEMLEEYICTVNDQQIPANQAITQLMKLREITSGFIINENHDVEWIGSNKYDELMELLDELGGEQAIIWANFRFEVDRIGKMLGDSCVSYYGDTPMGDREDNLVAFRTGRKMYLVANPASIGHGITLTNCRYAIYFSMSHSYELITQSQERIYRIGQKNKCQYFYLLVENSIDEKIYKAVDRKERISDSLLEMLK